MFPIQNQFHKHSLVGAYDFLLPLTSIYGRLHILTSGGWKRNNPYMGVNIAHIDTVTHSQALQLGERLAAQRLALNLTQRQLSEQAGVGINTLRRLEAGQNPSLDTLLRVLNALDLGDRIDALAPPLDVRPIDRVRLTNKRERQRASGAGAAPAAPWTWDDDS